MAYHTISKCFTQMAKLESGVLGSTESEKFSLLKMLSPDEDGISSVLKFTDISDLEGIIESQGDFYKELDDKRYPEIGKRVRRGRNWKWGDQDSSGVGTIIGHSPDKSSQLWVWVEWDADEEQNAYRWQHGSSKKSDVMIVDEARTIEAGIILAVGTKVRKADTEAPIHTMTGVVIKLTEDEDEKEKALVRWQDKSREKYFFGKGETPTEIVPIPTKGKVGTETNDSSGVSLKTKDQTDTVGVPSSPEGPVEITDVLKNSAVLTWKKPNEEGTSSVTHFEIAYSEITKTYPLTIDRANAGAASVSHRLVHLKGYTEYIADIRAFNAVGCSKPLRAPFKTNHELDLYDEDVSQTLMTEKHIARFVEAIGSNWDFLAIELDVNHIRLDHLRESNCTTQTQILNMLRSWRQQKAEKATFGELIRCMKLAQSTTIEWAAVENIAKAIKSTQCAK